MVSAMILMRSHNDATHVILIFQGNIARSIYDVVWDFHTLWSKILFKLLFEITLDNVSVIQLQSIAAKDHDLSCINHQSGQVKDDNEYVQYK